MGGTGRTRRALKNFAIAAALALIATVLVHSSGEDAVAQLGCDDVHVIGARGSGQTGNDGGAFGPQVLQALTKLRQHLPGNLSLDAHAVDYASVGITARLATASGRDEFFASIRDSVDRAQDEFDRAVAAGCRRLVLIGFSQGALVIHTLLLQLTPAERRHIAAVMLLSDPGRRGASSVDRGSAPSNRNGIYFLADIDFPAIPTDVRSRTGSWCVSGDPVCDYTAPHLANEIGFGTIHVDTYQGGPGTSAGQFAAALIVPKCDGDWVTIARLDHQPGQLLRGTAGNDVISGSPGADIIEGGPGADTICGRGGNDVLRGQQGLDVIFGQSGHDRISGGKDRDRIFGGSGNDVIFGNSGNDFLRGQSGDDTVRGGIGTDTIQGDKDNDTLEGGDDADHIYGGDGTDTIFGGSGWDTIWGGSSRDIIHGDGGRDTIRGESGNDSIWGDSGRDTIYGGSGGDWIRGGTYGDVLRGNSGHDRIWGNSGNDDIDGGSWSDPLLDGGTGNDTIRGSTGNDALNGAAGTDDCDGGSGADTEINCESPLPAMPPLPTGIELEPPWWLSVRGRSARYVLFCVGRFASQCSGDAR